MDDMEIHIICKKMFFQKNIKCVFNNKKIFDNKKYILYNELLKKIKLNIKFIKSSNLTWGRYGFDGGKMGLISEPREAWCLDNKVCIKYKRRRQFCISSLI